MDSNTTNNTQNSQPQDQPGLIAGHVEYVKGAVQSTVGAVTGSHAWTSSGEQTKARATDTMKVAGEQRDAQAQGYGKIEELAGKATGCEGMQKEGAASLKKE